jgi:hypothetical protein
VPVVGEWFVELAKEHGVYERPTEKLGNVMSWFSALTAAPWFYPTLTFFAGAALALWVAEMFPSRRSDGENSKAPRSLAPDFFVDRTVLDRESPVADKMKKAERLYAMWLTGTKMIQEIKEVSKVDRLLLPDPNSNSLAFFQSALSPEDRRNIAAEIRQSTAQARLKRIQVRWLKEFSGYSLTIGNPQSADTWVQIEMALPVLHGSRRSSFEFKRPQHAAPIDDIMEMFDRLWTNGELSREPRDDELPTAVKGYVPEILKNTEEKIPLRQAARIAYERFENTQFGRVAAG